MNLEKSFTPEFRGLCTPKPICEVCGQKTNPSISEETILRVVIFGRLWDRPCLCIGCGQSLPEFIRENPDYRDRWYEYEKKRIALFRLREMTPEEERDNGKNLKRYNSLEEAVFDGIAYYQFYLQQGRRAMIPHPNSAWELIGRGLGVAPSRPLRW
jgi:hypothetical protein